LALPAVGNANHANRESSNITALGESIHEATYPVESTSDLAFWGDIAYQGNYDGFRVLDVSDPMAPEEITWHADCEGSQGDVMIWDNILIRSYNSAAPADDPNTPEDERNICGGQPVPAGFEGLHFFDVGDHEDIQYIGAVEITNNSAATGGPGGGPIPGTETSVPNPAPPPTSITVNTGCGSHTASLAPDMANNRLLIYNSGSSSNCPGIDIVEVPLDNPANATWLRREQTGRSCHDTAILLGRMPRAACAGGDGFTVMSMEAAHGGTLENPAMLYSVAPPLTTTAHSVSFTPDGKAFVFGHEPGGGSAARCQLNRSDAERTFRMYETDSGRFLGRWMLDRAQGPTENCTPHNFNFVPTTDGRRILISGNYQAGTYVTDWTDADKPKMIAYSDPAPISDTQIVLGGAWSSYWYNGLIYESDITRGLHIFRFDGPEVASAQPESFSNPQTQMDVLDQTYRYDSNTSIRHTGSPHRFKGTVRSDSDDARCNVRNIVVKKGNGDVVARTKSDTDGDWSVAHNKGGKGTYRAYAQFKSIDLNSEYTDDTLACRRAESSALQVTR
jgi:hypothetical protein